jgi:hypothetical protein
MVDESAGVATGAAPCRDVSVEGFIKNKLISEDEAQAHWLRFLETPLRTQ